MMARPRRAGAAAAPPPPAPPPPPPPAGPAGAGARREPAPRAVAPPVHTATTFERAADYSLPGGRDYARPRNPAFDQPEALLAALEGGAAAMLFASGMAAGGAGVPGWGPGG